MEQKIEKIHQFVLKMPRFLEKVVAAILLVGVTYSCVQLGVHVLAFSDQEFNVYVEDILLTAFNAIIVIEFICMLIKHSMNTIVEVLILGLQEAWWQDMKSRWKS